MCRPSNRREAIVSGSTSASDTPPRVTCAFAKPWVPVTTSRKAGKRAAKRVFFIDGKHGCVHVWRKARFPDDRLGQQARQNACRQRQQGNGRKLLYARVQPRADGRDLRQKIDGKTNVALLRQRGRDLAGKLEDADTRYAVIRQQQLADFLCGRRSVDEQGQSACVRMPFNPLSAGWMHLS